MRCIPADFNDLDAWEHDQIILGPIGDSRYEAYELHEGERVIAEDGTLQAEGVLGAVTVDGERWWVVVIDRATMRVRHRRLVIPRVGAWKRARKACYAAR